MAPCGQWLHRGQVLLDVLVSIDLELNRDHSTQLQRLEAPFKNRCI